jgi:hypothetical protein
MNNVANNPTNRWGVPQDPGYHGGIDLQFMAIGWENDVFHCLTMC